jgi:hypothetical protein
LDSSDRRPFTSEQWQALFVPNCWPISIDAGCFYEPAFSDGLVADAVNTVVNSKTLPGKPVIYTSSGGNAGNNLFDRDHGIATNYNFLVFDHTVIILPQAKSILV